MSDQPNLFEKPLENAPSEKIALFALGEFQSRGFELIGRELALDRLLGAFKRAAEKFQSAELSDEQIAENLERLGANVKKLPPFVAKHPFRVTVSEALAENAREFFQTIQDDKTHD